jgi:hypothetical protein
MKLTHTAGKWNPKAWPIYFAASNMDTFKACWDLLTNVLIAVNEMKEVADNPAQRTLLDKLLDTKTVLLDSGVYWLSTQHANKHGLSMDQALGMAPDKIDGFDKLFENYVIIAKTFGDRSWGYIEIDQGGKDNKIKTRARLEKLGLRPIPVYHPVNDGWDYFDYLAKRYDRICLGNVVMADQATRKRLIATAWERRREYPNLWIHALGLTPSELTTAYPMNSCDSSTWIAGIRWGVQRSLIANANATNVDRRFIYSMDVDPEHARGHTKATMMCAYDAMIMNRTMKSIAGEQTQQLGADIGLFD